MIYRKYPRWMIEANVQWSEYRAVTSVTLKVTHTEFGTCFIPLKLKHWLKKKSKVYDENIYLLKLLQPEILLLWIHACSQ